MPPRLCVADLFEWDQCLLRAQFVVRPQTNWPLLHPGTIALLPSLSRRTESLYHFDAPPRVVLDILIRRGKCAYVQTSTRPYQAMRRYEPQMRSRRAHWSIIDLQRLSHPNRL
jgi:hypothetical protein